MRELSGISRSSLDQIKAATALAFRKMQPHCQGEIQQQVECVDCSSGSAWHAAAVTPNSGLMHMMRQHDKWGSMARRSAKPLQRCALLTSLMGACHRFADRPGPCSHLELSAWPSTCSKYL